MAKPSAQSQTTYTLDQVEEDLATLRGQVDQLDEILKMTDGGVNWNGSGGGQAGAWLYSAGGALKFASTDGNAYGTGRATLTKDAAQTVNSTIAQTITFTQGNSLAVASGAVYRFRAWVRGKQTNAATVADVFQFTAPAMTFSALDFAVIPIPGTQASTAQYDSVAFSANISTAGWANNQVYRIEVEGVFQPSANGSIALVAACTTSSANTFQVLAASFMEIMPVT